MPTYLMQITTSLPAQLCDNINKKSRSFVWGSNDEQKKVHLIKWDNLRTTRKKGGLGLRKARDNNAAFLTKLAWGIISRKDSLWARKLRSKYGAGEDLLPRVVRRRTMSQSWKGMSRIMSNRV